MAPETAFPLLARATTASNIVDTGDPCLLPNTRAAPPNGNRLHWLYERIAMEGILTSEKIPTSGKMSGSTADGEDLQGLGEGSTRCGIEE